MAHASDHSQVLPAHAAMLSVEAKRSYVTLGGSEHNAGHIRSNSTESVRVLDQEACEDVVRISSPSPSVLSVEHAFISDRRILPLHCRCEPLIVGVPYSDIVLQIRTPGLAADAGQDGLATPLSSDHSATFSHDA